MLAFHCDSHVRNLLISLQAVTVVIALLFSASADCSFCYETHKGGSAQLVFSLRFLVLQETGIGKTVNGYRKYDDPVGKKAKSIVNKWKGLVQAAIAEEESSQRNCNSPVKESEKLPVSHESVSSLPSYVSLELNQKKKGGDCRDFSDR